MSNTHRHPDLPSLLTVQEVAALCRVSVRTVRRWVATGTLTAHHLGRQIRIERRDLERFLAASRSSGPN